MIEKLDQGFTSGCRLTLISASAGFGKTTLVSEWIAGLDRPVAWLSLDEGDNDPSRFLSYVIAALQTIAPKIGAGMLAALQSPQPLQIETILTSLLNDISLIQRPFLLVLDDYHSIESQAVDRSLDFIIEHQPPQMHLVIATREDPQLPLARLRARGQCTELRAADLRFSSAEAAEFLNQLMGLNLSAEDVASLETRTEGWIVGLQLAALSMQGNQDTTRFIQSFTGSHHFVLDYLMEEVLGQQSASTQTFLLHTSILERMCGPLCEAILLDPAVPGQATLEYLQRANLFIVPLDDERRWYRYHHLFGDLLRKRLGQNLTPGGIAELHIHASQWYENNYLMLEAFKHAATANDNERAERLMESKKMPIHLRGTATTILNWLESLPKTLPDARPALWWKQAALLLEIGQTVGVEERLQTAENALATAAMPDNTTRDLIGKIALARATLALNQFEIETILVQARRALEYLDPDNLSYRSTAALTLGFAYYLQEDLAEAGRAFAESLTFAQAGGDILNTLLATFRLGQIQEHNNQLYQAVEIYQQVLELIGEYSPSDAAMVYISLASICYEWNDLNATENYLEQGMQLAQQYDHIVDREIICYTYLARLKLARGDVIGAASIGSQAEQTAHQKNVRIRLVGVAYLQAWIRLRQGAHDAVVQLARQNDLSLMQARALIAQGHPSEALELVEPQRQQAEEKRLPARLLLVKAMQSVVLFAQGEKDQAMQVLAEALAMAEPGGFIRIFVDEGALMAELLLEAASRGIMPDYVARLLAAFEAEKHDREDKPDPSPAGNLVEPLSQRELKILQLIAQGLSNREIGERLFLALDTIKGHNRILFDKLQVQSRTEAVARAHDLGLI